MSDKIKPSVQNNIMYPWAMRAGASSVLFFVETSQTKGYFPLKVISSYYSLFHMGIFAIYTCSQADKYNCIKNKKLPNLIEASVNKGEDPTRRIKHEYVCEFLNARGEELKEISSKLRRLKEIREYINYGFSVKCGPECINIEDTTYLPTHAQEMMSELEDSLIKLLKWSVINGADEGIWPQYIFSDNGVYKYFYPKTGLYLGWLGEEELKMGLEFSKKLGKIAAETYLGL
jgi:hypothetical protein